jgi:hypothetical protein
VRRERSQQSVLMPSSDGEDVLCGACGDPIQGMSLSECDQCHNDLHEPDDCHDVWHPHAVYKFCAKGCAAKFLRQLPDAPAFDLVQRMPREPAIVIPPKKQRLVKDDGDIDDAMAHVPLPLLPVGTGQDYRRQTVAAASRAFVTAIAAPCPVQVAIAPATPAASVLAYVDPLDTPRPNLLAAPLPAAAPWELKPRKIGSDAAQAGPNGAAEGCGLQPGEWKTLMCSVHVQRAVAKNKQYFTDPGNAGKMNVDIERLKNNSITEGLAVQGKKLLVIKYKAENEERAAAYFESVWQGKRWTYAEANAP